MADTAEPRAVGRRFDWFWFALWGIAGACLALVISQVGMVTVPLGIALALPLAIRAASRPWWPGLGVGAGLLFLMVALLNFGGPGTDCTVANGVRSCTEKVSPWPWAGVGVALIAGAIVVQVIISRKTRWPARGAGD